MGRSGQKRLFFFSVPLIGTDGNSLYETSSPSTVDATMNDPDPWPSDDWFDALAEGDPDVETEFWNAYGEPLRRVASRQISSALAKRVDPEDIVQSACRTFFRRVRQGEFQCNDST